MPYLFSAAAIFLTSPLSGKKFCDNPKIALEHLNLLICQIRDMKYVELIVTAMEVLELRQFLCQ